MARYRIDYENNADDFWRAMRTTNPEICARFDADSDNAGVSLTDEEFAAVSAITGYSVGPDHAKDALLRVNETKTYYQVIGWYRSLPPKAHFKSRTISDGAIFSTHELARRYAVENMVGWEIRPFEAQADSPAAAAADYCLRSTP